MSLPSRTDRTSVSIPVLANTAGDPQDITAGMLEGSSEEWREVHPKWNVQQKLFERIDSLRYAVPVPPGLETRRAGASGAQPTFRSENDHREFLSGLKKQEDAAIKVDARSVRASQKKLDALEEEINREAARFTRLASESTSSPEWYLEVTRLRVEANGLRSFLTDVKADTWGHLETTATGDAATAVGGPTTPPLPSTPITDPDFQERDASDLTHFDLADLPDVDQATYYTVRDLKHEIRKSLAQMAKPEQLATLAAGISTNSSTLTNPEQHRARLAYIHRLVDTAICTDRGGGGEHYRVGVSKKFLDKATEELSTMNKRYVKAVPRNPPATDQASQVSSSPKTQYVSALVSIRSHAAELERITSDYKYEPINKRTVAAPPGRFGQLSSRVTTLTQNLFG